MKSSSGFTLVEVLIAMVVTMVILGGAYSVFNSQQKTTVVQTNVSDAQQTLRVAMDFVARDLRMAGYDPEISSDFKIENVNFRDLDDANDANGNSYIRFAWDRNSDGELEADIDGDGSISREEAETVEYSLVNSGTITPGTADLYIRYPGTASPQRDVLASNIVAFGLAYAIDPDGDGELLKSGSDTTWVINADNDSDWDSLVVDQAAGTATITDLGIPIKTGDIRAIRIWMLSQSETADPVYTDTNTYVIGPHVMQPNNNFRHRMAERIVLCRNMGLNL